MVIAIIQARMGSTRLPGKVLEDIGGKTMLACVVRRTQRATLVDKIVVATTMEPADDAIVAECKHLGAAVFRGSESDVLDRYYRAAEVYEADTIVRITADCPLIDPGIIDHVVRAFLEERPDYASNTTLTKTYPHGLDVEVMTMAALAFAWQEARKPYQRAHVTVYIYENPWLFQLLAVPGEIGYGHCRWTVDTPEDLAFVREVYARLDDDFAWHDVLQILAQEPQLMELNRHVRQKALREG